MRQGATGESLSYPYFGLANTNGSFKISLERNDACLSSSRLIGWPCKHSTQVPLPALP
jgi:hypothetical protein